MMAFYPQVVLDAAKNAVDALKEVILLRSQLILTPTTEEDINSNIAVNELLRIQQKVLKDNNNILRLNKTIPLLLSETKLDDTNAVIAPWEFSNLIQGTRQYVTGNNSYQETSIVQNNVVIQEQKSSLQQLSNGLSANDIIRSTNDISRLQIINNLLENNTIVDFQTFRTTLENNIREQNSIITSTLSAIQLISNEIISTTDDEQLQILIQELNDTQDQYQTAQHDKKILQEILDDFLLTPGGQTTKVSQVASQQLENVSSSEQIAINVLRKQYVDRMNLAQTDEYRRLAYKDIVNLDTALKTNNIERTVLSPPSTQKIQDYNVQLQTLINERDELQQELLNTDPSDTTRIAYLNVLLTENNNNRAILSKEIIGLQNNLGFGLKVSVITDDNRPKLIIYNTQTGTYTTDDVYFTDLIGNSSVIKETTGLLSSKEYEMLKFVSATQVYDSRTGKIVPRTLAETGQESRYTNIRPLLQDAPEFANEMGITPLQEYQNAIAVELQKLQYDFDNSIENKTYVELTRVLNQYVYDTYVKPVDDQIFINLEEMKKTLLEIGLSDEVASNFVSISNIISTDEFVQTITETLPELTPEIRILIDKFVEKQIENITLSLSVDVYRTCNVGLIDFGPNIGQIFAVDATGKTLQDVIDNIRQQTFDIGDF